VTDGIEEGEEVVVGPFKVLEKIKHDELVKREDEPGAAEEEEEEADQKPQETETETETGEEEGPAAA
jgi:hypothetical protein